MFEIITDPIEFSIDNYLAIQRSVSIKHYSDKRMWLRLVYVKAFSKSSLVQIERELGKVGYSLEGWSMMKDELDLFLAVL